MNTPSILCPVDFSPCSNAAFVHAIDIAKCRRARVIMAHVTAPPPTFISGYAGYGALPPYQPEPDGRLEEIQCPDDDVILERVHLVGMEGEAIVKYAADANCDLIVLGTHGYSGLTRLMLGSVADYVVRHAKCPVYVIKDMKRERQARFQEFAADVQGTEPSPGIEV